MKELTTSLILITLVFFSACKQKQDPQTGDNSIGDVSKSVQVEKQKFTIDATKEADYLVDTYANGLYAIRAAEIVKEKAKNENIKAVADKIASTHKKIVEELDQLAKEKKISLPSDLNQFQRSELVKLEKNDKNLEQVFIQQMEIEHKEDIELLEKISKESEDNEISTVAIAYLPTLKTQYDEVVAAKERMNL